MLALLFHFVVTGVAYAWAGTMWAVVLFLAVALVRVGLRAQALERDNELLMARLPEGDRPLTSEDLEALSERRPLVEAEDPPPHSGLRPSLPAVRKATGS